MVDEFTSNMQWVFDILAPIKIAYVRETPYPWITYNIKLLMRRRDEAQIRTKRTNTESRLNYYRDLKYQVVQAISREKSAYFNTHINSNFKNSAILWNHLKRIINIKQKYNHIIPENLNDPTLINTNFLKVPGSSGISLETINFYNSHK
ncbi:unnamed protein product [Euphydryas editha]|uniref:Uncharacterized protein n=1 Tax=Euphydryas editha TaxID=104508 RepID=A0AAU9TTR9_EUPED|nr:unnamed protein product [Euphydryas editha]